MNVNLFVLNFNILNKNDDLFTVAQANMKTQNPQQYWLKNFPKTVFKNAEFKPVSLRGYQQIANVPNEISLDMSGAILSAIKRIPENGALYLEKETN